MKDIDLTSSAWCELVFEGRNKSYGAYSIRRESSDRHLAALLIMISLGVAAALGVNFYNKLTMQNQKTVAIDPSGPIVMVQIDPIEKPVVQPIQAAEPPSAIRKTVRYTLPVVKPDDQATGEELASQDALNLDRSAAIGTITHEGTNDVTAPFIEDIAPIVEKKPEIIDFAEQMPEYPGGQGELMKFLSSNIKYPVIAQEQNIQGTVLLRFVVSTDGSVSDVQIVRSLDPSCDREAVRVVKSMGKWIPGRQNGTAVNVFFTLPIRFKLAN